LVAPGTACFHLLSPDALRGLRHLAKAASPNFLAIFTPARLILTIGTEYLTINQMRFRSFVKGDELDHIEEVRDDQATVSKTL
jgi:hypothetical protein